MCSPPNLPARIADRHYPQYESHAWPPAAVRLLVGARRIFLACVVRHPFQPGLSTNLDRTPASKNGGKWPGTFLPHPGWRAGSRDSSILRPRRNRAIQFPLHPLNCPLRRALFFDEFEPSGLRPFFFFEKKICTGRHARGDLEIACAGLKSQAPLVISQAWEQVRAR